MKRILSGLAATALLAGTVSAACPVGGCLSRAIAPRGGVIDAAPIEFDIQYNHAWLTPFGGYTLYPGQIGSGYSGHSDYSRVEWFLTPTDTAAVVRAKLQALGIPAVKPETVFLGKIPGAADNIKLPLPRPREKEKEAEKDRKGDKEEN